MSRADGRDVAAMKSSLRSWALERLAEIPALDRRQAQQRVRELLEELLRERRPALVAGYAPLPGELSLEPWLESLPARGVRLAFPAGESAQPVLREVRSLRELGRGPGGYLQPDERAPVVAVGAGDLVLVPGLLFDRRGARLGRGGGFYDRLLGSIPATSVVLGVGFAAQIVAELPLLPHDVILPAIASERGVQAALA